MVSEIQEVITDLKNGQYARIMSNTDKDVKLEVKGLPTRENLVNFKDGEISQEAEGEMIKVMDVPLITPNGEKLIETPLRFVVSFK